MNTRALMDDATALASNCAWLARELAPLGAPGVRAARTWDPFVPGEEDRAQAEVLRVSAAAAALAPQALAAIRALVASCPDPLPIAQAASAGDTLEDTDFFVLVRFCATLESARAHAGIEPTLIPDACTDLAAALAPGARSGGGFYLDDAFAAELAAARSVAAQQRAVYEAVHGRLLARVAQALKRDDLHEAQFILMRDRHRGPLPGGVRVVRETPTYFLCEVDLDEGAIAALALRDEAMAASATAEDRVRARLSGLVRENAAHLARSADQMGALDLFLARVAFAQRHHGVAPQIARESLIAFEDARFVPLAESLARRGRAYTPISLELQGVATITGPNMGGKTAALATCAFVAACAAWGVPVPAARARVSLFHKIAWLSGGSEDPDRDALLSSFGREVVALRVLLALDVERTLVLVDEFARTTNPSEAHALSVALVRTLAQRGALALLATHLGGLARDAGAPHFAVAGLRSVPAAPSTPDLAAALEAIGGAMDYRIVRVGDEGHVPSDAIALAGLLGLGDAFIAEARAALAPGPRA